MSEQATEKWRMWTPEEDAFLRANRDKMSRKEMALQLNRTAGAISTRFRTMPKAANGSEPPLQPSPAAPEEDCYVLVRDEGTPQVLADIERATQGAMQLWLAAANMVDREAAFTASGALLEAWGLLRKLDG